MTEELSGCSPSFNKFPLTVYNISVAFVAVPWWPRLAQFETEDTVAIEENVQLAVMDLHWKGPYGWPGMLRADGALPLDQAVEGKHGGVYLQAIVYNRGGYILLGAGITRRPFPKRFAEHKREYLRGNYNILDMERLRAGVRREIWHGWTEARRPERRLEFMNRRAELEKAALEQIGSLHIFVAKLEDKRLQARTEAAIMARLYSTPEFCHIPDRGYHLEPRYKSEVSIIIRNHCDCFLHCLPHELMI